MLLKSGMKASLQLVLGLGAAAAFFVAYPAKANLITNSGFETNDFTAWTVSGRDNDVVNSVPFISPHSGECQALFGVLNNSITQNVATTSGSSYVIHFWLAAKIYNPVAGSFSVNWGGSTVFSHLFPLGIYGYTEYTFTVNGLSPTTALQFQFSNPQHTSNTFYLDDVSVNPTGVGVPDTGSTVSLLGFALLGLAWLRRRLSC
jgi:VPDSG-CTERM motif